MLIFHVLCCVAWNVSTIWAKSHTSIIHTSCIMKSFQDKPHRPSFVLLRLKRLQLGFVPAPCSVVCCVCLRQDTHAHISNTLMHTDSPFSLPLRRSPRLTSWIRGSKRQRWTASSKPNPTTCDAFRNEREWKRKLFWGDVADPPSVLQILLLPAEENTFIRH